MAVSTSLGFELHILQQISLWNLAVASASTAQPMTQPQHFALTLRYLHTSLLLGCRSRCFSTRVSAIRIEFDPPPIGLGALFGLLFSLEWPQCCSHQFGGQSSFYILPKFLSITERSWIHQTLEKNKLSTSLHTVSSPQIPGPRQPSSDPSCNSFCNACFSDPRSV